MYLLSCLAEVSPRATLVSGAIDYTQAIEDAHKEGDYHRALLLQNQREALISRHRQMDYLESGRDYGQRAIGWIDTGVLPG